MYLFRPDTVSALRTPLVKKVLPRYVKTVENKANVNFQIAKKITLDLDEDLSPKGMLREHSKLMEEFYETRRGLDERELKVEGLENPRFSLFDLKIMIAEELMKSCELCERKCHVNRSRGEVGECGVGDECLISTDFTHWGEEFHISPSHTIFFMGCNFHCQFCQNWSISQWYESGQFITPRQMARRIELKRREGCRNVNLVGGEPTPNLLNILKALKMCKANVPVVWNSNFYMSEKTMEILDGVVDLYLSDFKYGNDECAERLSKVPNYFKVSSRNHLLASKQAELTVRHLILPNHLECCTKPILEWIAENIRDKCIVNLMDQYRPEFKAMEYKEINRRITREEFREAADYAEKLKINYIT